jgi:predicted phosphodiesterase
MRQWLQRVLGPVVVKLAHKYDGKPNKERVFTQLTALYHHLLQQPSKRGLVLPFNNSSKFIILSDQHKGAKDDSDDFVNAEGNYLAALDYYYQQGFCYINLGDSEELWENSILAVKAHNKATFAKEAQFLQDKRFFKIFGNHDLYWDNDPLAAIQLKSIYGQSVSIYEGLILQTTVQEKQVNIFLTHGHQGDLQSDGNWFSKWFVSTIWAPLQAYLHINLNTPSNNDTLKTVHNTMMYEWTVDTPNTLLITGHTHQPVFASFTHIEWLYKQLAIAKSKQDVALISSLEKEIATISKPYVAMPDFTNYQPRYFNSGCCCFSDGDITGIEIADGNISLVKWHYDEQQLSKKQVLQMDSLVNVVG